ncbi:hypothetical protein [Paraburkholderia tuberum]|uniref:Uncharacterized protein n=1 Tax=Paraburkholderia tuberum TaxID=157910 RepID=A0A1H1DS12_9BURK|nr:hypothetical protein [Paraburkholderia tuberum]SDQ79302.1 hypothetical protein SAMN05445850_1760 [Paraburkholderia tuberum]
MSKSILRLLDRSGVNTGQCGGAAYGIAGVAATVDPQRAVAMLLAILATSTSLGIAALSGWQHGGSLPEQLACIALAAAAVLGMHLLPALSRGKPVAVRGAAAALWGAGLIVVFYGQTSFFLLAQQHAGERRAKAVPATPAALAQSDHPMRDLTAIAQEQLKTRASLGALDSRPCSGDCTVLRMRRDLLTAKLDALATEAGEAKRRESAEDRQTEQAERATRMRDALRDDPVTVRLADWFGVNADQLDLLFALVCACVLDGIGAMGWYFALSARRRDDATGCAGVVTTGKDGHDSVRTEVDADDHDDHVTSFVPDQNVDARLQQLMCDVVEGKLPVTVTGIRNHLGCAQATAAKLRRELLAFGAVTVRSNGGRHACN